MTLDIWTEYTDLRTRLCLMPHDFESARDAQLLDFFMIGVIRGVNHTLLCIKEKTGQVAS